MISDVQNNDFAFRSIERSFEVSLGAVKDQVIKVNLQHPVVRGKDLCFPLEHELQPHDTVVRDATRRTPRRGI